MEDSKSKKGVGPGGPQGVGVPAKGDSDSAVDNVPYDPLDHRGQHRRRLLNQARGL